MTKTIKQLETELKEVKLQSEAKDTRIAELLKEKEKLNTILTDSDYRHKCLREDHFSTKEVLDALYKKYQLQSPEKVIVTILEEQEIPEQVSLLKQITAKKLAQWQCAADKAAQAAKFYTNNINDLTSNLERAAKGDIVTLP